MVVDADRFAMWPCESTRRQARFACHHFEVSVQRGQNDLSLMRVNSIRRGYAIQDRRFIVRIFIYLNPFRTAGPAAVFGDGLQHIKPFEFVVAQIVRF